MKSALIGILAGGAVLAGAGSPAADEKAWAFVEGVAFGNTALCPPCMPAWVGGARPGSRVILQVTDLGAPPPQGVELPLTSNPLGMCYGPVTGVGTGNMRITPQVNGLLLQPIECIGPFRPNPADCPPSPYGEITTIRFGRGIEVPVKMPGDAIAGTQLDRLQTGEKPGWVPVKAEGHFSADPRPHVTFDTKVDTGVYRAQFLDRERKVREVRLVQVLERERPGQPVPGKPLPAKPQ